MSLSWCARRVAPLCAVALAIGCSEAPIVPTVDGSAASANSVVAAASTAPVATIVVSVAHNPVATGQTTTATATLYDAQGTVLTDRAVQWSSSNITVVTVTGSGTVAALLPGAADVIATSEGVTGRQRVTVSLTPVRVATVSVSVDSSSLAVGHSAQATATTRDAYGNVITRPITWSSSNTGVATVSSTGVITAVAGGAADIIATSDGKSGWATIRIVTPVATVAAVGVTLSASSLLIGQTTQGYATAYDGNGNVVSGRPATWASSNAAVATVSSAGIVTAVSAGSAVISATIDTKVGQATVMVSQTPVASVTVTLSAPSVSIGQTTQANATTRDASGNTLTGRPVAWTSSNTSVATVDSTGLVRSVAAGTANITATSEGKSGQATLTVNQVPVASVTVSPSSASLTVGQTTQLTATARDANNNVLTGRSVTWSSSNPSIASVNSSGLVTANGPGSATIVASSEGKAGSAAVAVASSVQASGSASISGSVSDPSTGAVGGGVVEVLSGPTVIQTVPVKSDGTFSVSSLTTGNYGVRLQPPFTHSMGPAEPPQQYVSVTNGQATTVQFAVQKAHYADDFQSYTSSSQLNSGSSAAGNFWAGANHDIGAVANPQFISLDPSGGINGGKAMRYDWPARATAPCTGSEITIGVMPRLNPPPAGMRNLWIRFTSKESPNFAHGLPGCGGRSYKFFLIHLENLSAGRSGRFGTYLGDGVPTSNTSTRLWMDMNDNQGSQNMQSALPIGGDGGWGGVYHTWVIEMTGIGTAATTFRTYMDGQLVGAIQAPFLNGQTLGGGWSVMFEMGANMNNGPDRAQSRWWREFGVYTTRPSLIP
jgi:uncharacterized protein YjdB